MGSIGSIMIFDDVRIQPATPIKKVKDEKKKTFDFVQNSPKIIKVEPSKNNLTN